MDYFFYTFLFIALYFQVFFLVSYLGDSTFYEDSENNIIPKKPNISVTLIVACWNEEKTVLKTIESLLQMNYLLEYLQIIIVDDGSTDQTWQKMQYYKDTQNIILLKKKNGGKFTAINTALKHARGDLIATVDADTLLDKNALLFMVQDFIDDSELSALGSTILLKKPITWVQLAQMVEYQMFSFTKLVLARMNGALVVPGAFSMYRKEVFEKIGNFHEAHLLEDLEFTFRMQKAGLKVGQSKRALAYTNAPENIVSLFKQRLRWSYGFLMNAYDYRSMIKGDKNFNFGIFTLPMSIFSYLATPIVFISSWFYVIRNIIERFFRVSLLGWGSFFEFPNFDFNNISFSVTFFISIFIYFIVFFMIFSGRKIIGNISKNPFPIIIFFVLYGFLVPFWVLKSLYKIIFAKKFLGVNCNYLLKNYNKTMKKYFIVFLITASMFLSAFYITGKINNTRVKKLNNLQEKLSLNILSTETRFALLKESSCDKVLKGSNLEIGITEELNSLAQKIKFLESTLDKKNDDLTLLKDRYALLQIKDYLLVKELAKKCKYTIATILYFYDDNCPQCKNQSLVLDKIRDNYNHVRVYWFDASLDTPTMNIMKDIFSIKNYPAIVIGKDVYQKFISYDELSKKIETWTTEHHALVETAEPEAIKKGLDFILEKNETFKRSDISFVSFEKGIYNYRIKSKKNKDKKDTQNDILLLKINENGISFYKEKKDDVK